jgi:hypothetical protein
MIPAAKIVHDELARVRADIARLRVEEGALLRVLRELNPTPETLEAVAVDEATRTMVFARPVEGDAEHVAEAQPDVGQPPEGAPPAPSAKPWPHMSAGEKVIALRERQGKTWAQIAAELGAKVEAVRSYARFCGIKGRGTDAMIAARAKAASEREATIRALAATGRTAAQIAALTGTSTVAIYKFAHSRGIRFSECRAAPEPALPAAEAPEPAPAMPPRPYLSAATDARAKVAVEREERIRALVAEGKSVGEIAELTGSTAAGVRQFAKVRRIPLARQHQKAPAEHRAAPGRSDAMTREERDAAIRGRIADGRSALAIAIELGAASRNVIIGYAARRGIALKAPPGTPNKLKNAGLRAQMRKAAVRQEPAPKPVFKPLPPRQAPAIVAPAPVTVAPPSADPPAGGVHLLDLGAEMCRRPLWPDAGRPDAADLRFCGARTEGPKRSYCAACEPRMVRRVSAKAAEKHFDRMATVLGGAAA